MHLNENGEFIIKNYQNCPTFSSFLPGIAGKLGIPIWAFYVNRGQAIASFGIENKDQALMEFEPANKSYRTVSTRGFRTFIKIINKKGNVKIYEPFAINGQKDDCGKKIDNKMIIKPYSLIIEEINKELKIRVKVKYFILPNEDLGALVRRVSVENLSKEERELTILDGMPEMIPYGISNSALKEVSQTMAAWCRVYNLDNKIPFYRVKATTDDSPEVREMRKGNFYLAFSKNNQLLTPIVDPELVFGEDTSFKIPKNFINHNIYKLLGDQMTENRFPSAMSILNTSLPAGKSIKYNSLFGHVASKEKLIDVKNKVTDKHYLDNKEEESKNIHKNITNNIFTKSGLPKFNYYCQQTFLDNILRGGFPITVGEEDNYKMCHIYSRKHGDLERDYNFFHLEASSFSQGNGNYRDINQNRRCDNFFNPQVKDHNIKIFTNLIQADGYNPLVIKGSKYNFIQAAQEEIMQDVSDDDHDMLRNRFKKPFTPGELSSFIDINNIKLDIELEKFVEKSLSLSDSIIDAEFGEGYWIDHWTYILDLIENYLAVYPEKTNKLFFEDDSYYFYDSNVKVKPRSEKYVLTDLGPRQLNALEENAQKRKLIKSRKDKKYHLRTQHGEGEIYNTTLIIKLMTLVTNKISTMDPSGIGIEMEANKPGWYDALNGLPGIFGSSTAETMELKRLVDYILKIINNMDMSYKLILPIELYEFTTAINNEIEKWSNEKNHYNYWKQANKLKEKYREKVFWGFDGQEKVISISDLQDYLFNISKKLEQAVKYASNADYGMYVTYYYYLPVEYKETGSISKDGYPYIQVSKFERKMLPPFLEGQVRAMKLLNTNQAKDLHSQVKASELFDNKLKMYRLNGDLSKMPDAIGRARAFTPGWLENGSIWLHMEYKYLLELLKSGLYDEFYQSLKNCLIPFHDPELYGRSILENSSFIMSSSNPDQKNHGRGYVARLSGSTAEFLNIWSIMVYGKTPFKVDDGNLIFKPEPVLKTEFFTSSEQEVILQEGEVKGKYVIPENSFACRLLGETLLVYHNPERKDIYPTSAHISHYSLQTKKGKVIEVNMSYLSAEYASMIRSGKIKAIDVYFS